MRKSFVLSSVTRKKETAAAPGIFQRAFRRFRRDSPSLEQSAARGRAERLFEVNFRSTWTR